MTNTKYNLDNNKISKIIKNGNISKIIDYGEICNSCKNRYLRLFFSIEKSVNDDNILIRIPNNMLSLEEWIEEEKSDKVL